MRNEITDRGGQAYREELIAAMAEHNRVMGYPVVEEPVVVADPVEEQVHKLIAIILLYTKGDRDGQNNTETIEIEEA